MSLWKSQSKACSSIREQRLLNLARPGVLGTAVKESRVGASETLYLGVSYLA